MALTAAPGAVLVSMYLLARPTGLEWFPALFYLKLLVSHLPAEEPYARRTADGSAPCEAVDTTPG